MFTLVLAGSLASYGLIAALSGTAPARPTAPAGPGNRVPTPTLTIG